MSNTTVSRIGACGMQDKDMPQDDDVLIQNYTTHRRREAGGGVRWEDIPWEQQERIIPVAMWAVITKDAAANPNRR
jgi:hypothetical protein